ncbi:PucR family transcriptional regulator [Streptomyces sp. HM190]|uniref:PucR family transcriptional regulator n=1 Tax=Streptomyces sp. HM190 TaxID=2695266 RepID=UPI001359BE78|nr:PucR family transcriptional regulator [Streptomyces sp. HM190]
MRLHALLDQPGFGLHQLTGDASGPDAEIRGAHVLEVAEPLRWVPPGWIILTTGLRLLRRPQEQRRLIADLARGDIAALGFGVGVVFEDVPSALLEEARARQFPVFTVPEKTSFRDLVRFVDGELLSQESHVLRRTIGVRDRMIEAMGDPEPEAALVRRAAQSLRCAVTLFDHVGHVLTTSHPEHTDEQWRYIGQQARGPAHDPLSTGPVQAVRVLVEDTPVRWLAATAGPTSLQYASVERALRDGALLLTALHRMRRHEARALRSRQAGLLRDLLLRGEEWAGDPAAERALTERAMGFGIDLTGPGCTVLVLADPDGRPLDADTVTEVGRDLSREGRACLVAPVEGQAVIVLGDPEAVDAVLVLPSIRSLAVGVGGPSGTTAGLPRSWYEARLACARARRLSGRNGRAVVRQEQLGMVEWMTLRLGLEELEPRARTMLAPLLKDRQLLDTLRHYLATHRNASQTARDLMLHKNTLGYRLRRIEQLLQVDLNDPRDLTEVQVALTVLDA